MHQLDVPDPSSGLRLERDQAVGKEVVAPALPPIIIVGRRREGQIDIPNASSQLITVQTFVLPVDCHDSSSQVSTPNSVPCGTA